MASRSRETVAWVTKWPAASSMRDQLAAGRRSGLHVMSCRRSRRRVAMVGAHGSRPLSVIIVPMPSGVKISSSSACWTRPSRMWARRTPRLDGVRCRTRAWAACPAEIEPEASELPQFGDGDPLDQAVLVAEVAVQALDIGQVDELACPKRLGERTGRGVGVEVVGPAVLTPGQRGDHRHVALLCRRSDQRRDSPA